MAAMDDAAVANLLALHQRRHKQRAWYRLQSEVSDYLRRVAGLGPDARPIRDIIEEIPAAKAKRALEIAEATTTDITRLARAGEPG